MKLFELQRQEDATGVSGTGTVAQGIIFDNGKVCLTWLTEYSSVAVYDSIEEVIKIHGHDGKTLIVQVAQYNARRVQHLMTNWVQDRFENVGIEHQAPNAPSSTGKYLWEEREAWVELFRQQQFNTGNKEEDQRLMQCRALGWWCQDGHGPHHRFGSFCPCDENDPGAMPDKNRLMWFHANGCDTLYDGCDRVPRGKYKEDGGMVEGSR